MQEIQDYDCPYCGEPVEAVLDISGGDQTYIEDCPVCCRPIIFSLQTDGEEWTLDVTLPGVICWALLGICRRSGCWA
jgi:hypothetical protein